MKVSWAVALVLVPIAASAQAACPQPRLPAYAHNDYANARPLTDALAIGYQGFEADVFLIDGVLRLGHDRRQARTGASLEATYLQPLRAILARCVLRPSDNTRLLFAIELKEESRVAHDSLRSLLARYPEIAEGAEVVLVGWQPAPAVHDAAPMALARQHRLRAPIAIPGELLDGGVRLLSLDYGKTMGRWWVRQSSQRRWLAALRATKAAYPNRRLRVHNVPADSAVYRALLDAGVDLIGTKTLSATALLLEAADSARDLPPPAPL